MKFDPCNIELSEIQLKIENAIKILTKNDGFLLEAKVNERSISHKLAEYLQKEFHDWNVDCEYNKNFDKTTKVIDEWKQKCGKKDPDIDDLDPTTVYPDIVIHQRNSRNNLLIIEIKKSNNSDNGDCDKAKINIFLNNKLKYRYGLFINIGVDEKVGNNELEFFPTM